MRVRTGTKVLALAILFAGAGFWAGRGFPRTWAGMMPWRDAPRQEAGPTEPTPLERSFEERIGALERAVVELQGRSAPPAFAPEQRPLVMPVPDSALRVEPPPLEQRGAGDM